MNAINEVAPQLTDCSTAAGSICYEIRGLVRQFKGKSNSGSTITIGPIHAEIPANTAVAILGHSGAGKSTLLHLLGQLDYPADDERKGSVVYLAPDRISLIPKDDPATAANSDGRDELLCHFGYVFQSGYLLEHLSCEDNVALGLAIKGVDRGACRKTADDWLRRVGLEGFGSRIARRLSGGEKQRVAVLRAIAQSPRVLLADEPTASLDRQAARGVIEELQLWQRQGTESSPKTLILVTHQVDLAYDVCQHFLILRDGQQVGNRLFTKGSDVNSSAELRSIIESDHSVGSCEEEVKCNDRTLGKCIVEAETIRDPDDLQQAQQLKKKDIPTVGRDARPSLRYLFRLAVKDLLRREHFGLNVVAFVTLTLTLILLVAAIGLMNARRFTLASQTESAIQSGLTFSARRSDDLLDEDRIRAVREIALTNGAKPFLLDQGAFPWNTEQHLFHIDNSKVAAETQRTDYVNGRSADPSDPILRSFAVLGGRTGQFTSARSAEILVTAKLLATCGLPESASQIAIDISRQPMPLQIVGVAEHLPGGAQFILPNEFAQLLHSNSLDPNPAINQVAIEGVAAEVTDPLVKKLSDQLPHELTATRVGSSIHVKAGPGIRYKQSWFNRQVQTAINGLKGEFDISRFQIVFPTVQAPAGSSFRYLNATVYFKDKSQMREVAEAVRKSLKLDYDGTILDLVERNEEMLSSLNLAMVFAVFVAVFVAASNAAVNMYQRVSHRRKEIGILKANGMMTRHMLTIYGIEGLLVGSAISIVAIPLGILAGISMGRIFANGGMTALEVPFQFGIGAAVCVGITGMVVLLVATLAATCRYAWMTPLQAICDAD